jgi:hypothetical protein
MEEDLLLKSISGSGTASFVRPGNDRSESMSHPTMCECGAPKFGGSCSRSPAEHARKIAEIEAKMPAVQAQQIQASKPPRQLGGVMKDWQKNGGYD